MEGSRAGAGDYIASLLSSSPRLDFGVLGTDGGGEEEEDCLDRFCGDPGFAARAARLSSFSGQRFPGAAGLFGLPPPVPAASGGGGEFAGSREASSVSDPASVMKDANDKKRKAPAAAKGKGKESSFQVRELLSLLDLELELLPPRTPRSCPGASGVTDAEISLWPSRQGSRRIRTPRGARWREARGAP